MAHPHGPVRGSAPDGPEVDRWDGLLRAGQAHGGLELIDKAVELGWGVSIPDWPDGVKDVNDAVIKLGKLTTLLIILQAKETSKIKIEIRKKALAKRLRN